MPENEDKLESTFRNLYEKVIKGSVIVDKTGIKIIEIIDANILKLNPMQSILNFGIKKTNKKYCEKELKWYLSKSLSIKDYVDDVKIWNQICSKDGKKEINSNYGWCVFSDDNYNQYNNCLHELIQNRDSRRAIMIYNRPNIWQDYNREGMSDFICCLNNSFFIRENKLISIVHFRSNDLIYGFLNDFYFKCYIYKKLYNDLLKIYPTIKIGYINWHSSSLHVYEKHFNLLIDIVEKFYDNL